MYYYSCGKLLITAEYLILKGAKGLAIPTKYGQKMSIEKNTEKNIIWEAYSCLLYTSPSPRDVEESRMPSSA